MRSTREGLLVVIWQRVRLSCHVPCARLGVRRETLIRACYAPVGALSLRWVTAAAQQCHQQPPTASLHAAPGTEKKLLPPLARPDQGGGGGPPCPIRHRCAPGGALECLYQWGYEYLRLPIGCGRSHHSRLGLNSCRSTKGRRLTPPKTSKTSKAFFVVPPNFPMVDRNKPRPGPCCRPATCKLFDFCVRSKRRHGAF
jgi:hypothetical protein